MVLVKNWPFFHPFLLDNIGQENVFYDILERKNAFLGYKNNRFKKSKNWDFSKGVNLWFWSKIGHFPIVFFLMIRRPPRSTLSSSSAASDAYKRQCYNWKSWQADSVSISMGRYSLLLTFLMKRVVINFYPTGGGGGVPSLRVKRTFCEFKLWTGGNLSWCYRKHWLLMGRILSGQYIYHILMLISHTDCSF